MHKAGDVDEDVDRSDLGRVGVDGFGRQHVELGFLGAGEPVELVARDVGGVDRRALGDKGFGDCPAYPLPCRRDDRDLSLQPACHDVP